MERFVIIEGSVKLSQEELKITRTQAIPTPWGEPSAPFEFTEVEDKEIIVLPRHGRVCRKPPHLINYRANMWAIAQLAPKAVVALCSVGGIVEEDKPGSIAVPDQIIDYTWGRETSYNKGDSETITFIDFTEPFSDQLREKLLDAADDLLIPVIDGGTYAVRQGPRLETAAEIKKLAQDGAHYVGMTLMPEACLARELGLNYAAICQIVNPAAGIGLSSSKIDMKAFSDVSDEATKKSLKIALKAFESF